MRRLLSFLLAISLAPILGANHYTSDWSGSRTWIGPEFWSAPLQDWAVIDGRVECVRPGPNRKVILFTYDTTGGFTASVMLSSRSKGKKTVPDTGGFEFGIQGTLPDYRNAAVHGKGTVVGVRADGRLVAGDKTSKESVDLSRPVKLVLDVDTEGAWVLTCEGVTLEGKVAPKKAEGLVALYSSSSIGKNQALKNGQVAGWGFREFELFGDGVKEHADRAFGPLLWTQYSLSKQVLKMTALVPPMGPADSKKVEFRKKTANGWEKFAEGKIDSLSRTATIRIEHWDDTVDTPFRAIYDWQEEEHFWEGTIRRNPIDQDKISVAGFTGNTDYIFPNSKLASNVAIQNPDLLFFSGDQLYESVGGYGIVRTPSEVAAVDYLRKYWMFGWAFRDLMKDRPSLMFPDDHDVYHGNIWGSNGEIVPKIKGFADGGYIMAPDWVNAVQRTQCAHMPDPYDPTPIANGVTVYYGDCNYGGVSFAMLEDRKFKKGPATVLPNKGGRPDHVRPQDVDEATWDPFTLDVPEATLLGERQLNFLDAWAQDWDGGVAFKCVLSQTIFCNLANYHGRGAEYLIADLDSNGWPQTGRNKALDSMRRGFAFHYAGDQHLASIVHHGIDAQGDAGFSFCVPSIAAGYPRKWIPEEPWPNHQDGAPEYTGDFKEGLGNRVRVHAIGNPYPNKGITAPEQLGHAKSSGHGMVYFDKKNRTITMECWRLLFDANNPGPADQFPGWPRTIALEENYGREAIGHLPTLKFKDATKPVVQIKKDGKVVYTLRIGGAEFRPKVFAKGPHDIVIRHQGKELILDSVKPEDGELEVSMADVPHADRKAAAVR